jgi:tRNA-2-methylthio-N6-dimethylallyladenosine synthase
MNKEKLEISIPSFLAAKKRNNDKIERIDYKIEDKYKDLGLGKTYAIFTYGCQGNVLDSENMAGILEEAGYRLAEDKYNADVVILNTCAIRENAEDRIWGVLGQLKGRKQLNPNMVIAISGCMPQEEGATKKLEESYKFVDIILGTHNRHHLLKLIYNVYEKKMRVVEVLSGQGNIVENVPIVRNYKHKAFVNIMFGCDEFCTYCIVPYTRGRERSRAKEDILAEVNELVKEGYKEITLLGQNVNAYGKDLGNDYTFGDLLRDIDKTGIERVRFTSPHPRDMDENAISAMAECKSVMPHLHFPVQSGNDRVLKIMNRKYTREEYLYKIKRLKEEIPGISITTDIIVGYPGETREEFNDTLTLVEEAGFEGAFTFIYSKREGTPAAKMEDPISDSEKHKWFDELKKAVDKGYLRGTERFVGEVVEVLVDGESKSDLGMMSGYSKHNKLTHFKSNDKSLIGKIVKVKVKEAKSWFMIGDLVE